jgi:uncharacterized protein YgbK (DUF1537 family)
MSERNLSKEYLDAETVVEDWYKGINDVLTSQSRHELAEEIADHVKAQLTTALNQLEKAKKALERVLDADASYSKHDMDRAMRLAASTLEELDSCPTQPAPPSEIAGSSAQAQTPAAPGPSSSTS